MTSNSSMQDALSANINPNSRTSPGTASSSPANIPVIDSSSRPQDSRSSGASVQETEDDQSSYATETNAFRLKCQEELSESRYLFPVSKVNEHKAWENCRKKVEDYDNAMCSGWDRDIDTVLIFAGLFSAVVTAFTVESYQWLQPDSSDQTVQVLRQISKQLQVTSFDGQPETDSQPFTPSASARRINTFWFLSLTVALMAAIVGLLCKQWLREYQKDAALPHKESVAIRHLRFESLAYWKVENIITALPLLLQLALVLFFIGIIELLWERDSIVGGVIASVIILGLSAVLATTILPSATMLYLHMATSYRVLPPCAYKSPQAWALLRTAMACHRIVAVNVERLVDHYLPKLIPRFGRRRGSSRWRPYRSSAPFSAWLDAEKQVLRDRSRINTYLSDMVYWMDYNFAQNQDITGDLYHCVLDIGTDFVTSGMRRIPGIPTQRVWGRNVSYGRLKSDTEGVDVPWGEVEKARHQDCVLFNFLASHVAGNKFDDSISSTSPMLLQLRELSVRVLSHSPRVFYVVWDREMSIGQGDWLFSALLRPLRQDPHLGFGSQYPINHDDETMAAFFTISWCSLIRLIVKNTVLSDWRETDTLPALTTWLDENIGTGEDAKLRLEYMVYTGVMQGLEEFADSNVTLPLLPIGSRSSMGHDLNQSHNTERFIDLFLHEWALASSGSSSSAKIYSDFVVLVEALDRHQKRLEAEVGDDWNHLFSEMMIVKAELTEWMASGEPSDDKDYRGVMNRCKARLGRPLRSSSACIDMTASADTMSVTEGSP